MSSAFTSLERTNIVFGHSKYLLKAVVGVGDTMVCRNSSFGSLQLNGGNVITVKCEISSMHDRI